MNDTNKMFFDFAFNKIERKGVAELRAWLESTDFFRAPASSTFHGNYAGGLVDHSLHVYQELKKLCDFYCPEKYTEETIAIVALFHDLCKVNFYIESTRNVKDERTGQWYKVPFYKKQETNPIGGHGSKSMFLVMYHMHLTDIEAAAINCHMGPWDKQDYGNPGDVYENNELAWLLHVADERATYYRDEVLKV